jgi:signal recognition particle receptor subunit beta
MVQFNFSERTIKAKVVYYGPAQSGKTTNLEQIHRLTDPAGANRLVSLNTAQDRTLFFDLLPFSLGAVSGYDFKIQLYTVPGQVQYNATRRVVLAGADAVVFVSDSRKSMFKENLSAFENMKVNLLANRLVPEKVPLVLQYNKQDLPDLQTEAEMTKTLNPWGRRAFPATAASGAGVIETFVAVVQEMLTAIAVKYNLKEKGLDPASVPDVVAHAFRSLLTEASTAVPTPAAAKGGSPAKIVLSQPTDVERSGSLPAAPEAGLVSEELLHRAIRSNVELAEALSGLVREMSLGLGSVLSHAELLMVYREDQREKRSSAIHEIQREASRLRKMMDDLGQAGTASMAAPAPRAPAPPPAPRAPAPPPPPATSSVSDATIVPESLDGPIRAAVRAAQNSLAARGLTVDLRLPAGTPTPRCPAQGLQRAVTSLLAGVSRLSPEGSAVILRCERKPVLLRGRDGAEIKRDFLMLAAAHGGGLTPEEQQRILQGSDAGPLGETGRLVRELGGFVRFAPLPGGGLETRLFLPAA